MKKAVFFCLILVPFICTCATTPSQPPTAKWEYEKDAITLTLKTDKQLNLKDRKPHTLVVCVYQLKSPNAFSQLAGDRSGLYKLLECQVFDPSVAVSKQIIVNPGKDVNTKLDRAEGATYVAIVAGYYSIEKEKIVRIYKIPEVKEKKWLIMSSKTPKPGKLDINLILDPLQLQDPKPIKKP